MGKYFFPQTLYAQKYGYQMAFTCTLNPVLAVTIRLCLIRCIVALYCHAKVSPVQYCEYTTSSSE